MCLVCAMKTITIKSLSVDACVTNHYMFSVTRAHPSSRTNVNESKVKIKFKSSAQPNVSRIFSPEDGSTSWRRRYRDTSHGGATLVLGSIMYIFFNRPALLVTACRRGTFVTRSTRNIFIHF